MIQIENKAQCCGCGACYNICPTKAIRMTPDEKGFIYPQIESQKCIDCGLCVKVCDFRKFTPTELAPDCYAVKHIDENEISTSRSGAFFIALAQFVLSHDGVVFGCVIEDCRYVYIRYATDKEGVNAFKGSKYVQSDTCDTFSECEKFLKQGKLVLYSGLGCQIHGLISYLKLKKTDTAKLITCDIVCHGAPSPKLWRQYIDMWDSLNKFKVVGVDFRNKTLSGWRAHYESLLLDNNTVVNADRWTYMFSAQVMFRESCYNCKYTTPNRRTDFTIADFWGIEKNVPEFDDNKGVSLVLVRTEKAKKVFKQLTNINYVKTELENSLQPNLIHPSYKGKEYDRFWNGYKKNNQKTIKKYFFPSSARIFKQKIIRKLKLLRGKLGNIKRRFIE